MWTLYKLIFTRKSSHILKRYKIVQKLETQIEFFLSAVRRCHAARRSRGGHEQEAEAGGAPAKAPGRVAWTAGGTRSRLRGRGSLAMEVDVEMHGAPPRAPWRGTSGSAAAQDRRLRRSSSPSRTSPRASYRRSPRRRRCGRRRPRQPRVQSR
jgi:hypothetical protein